MCLSVYSSCSEVPLYCVLSLTVFTHPLITLTAQQITLTACLDAVRGLFYSFCVLRRETLNQWGVATQMITQTLYLITVVRGCREQSRVSVRGDVRGLKFILDWTLLLTRLFTRKIDVWIISGRHFFSLDPSLNCYLLLVKQKMTTNPVSLFY